MYNRKCQQRGVLSGKKKPKSCQRSSRTAPNAESTITGLITEMGVADMFEQFSYILSAGSLLHCPCYFVLFHHQLSQMV